MPVIRKELYRSRVKIMIDNILSWNSTEDYPIEVQVNNGYAPTMNLTVHKFVPVDEALLEHIVWREVGTPKFLAHPSTPYGLKWELKPEEIDAYIDGHVRYFMDESKVLEGPHTPLYSQTSLAAFEYSRSSAKLVNNSVKEQRRL